MTRPVLVKLGGSVVSDKGRVRVFHRGTAKRLVNEAARSGVPLVLLHGAGGFGHPPAAQYGLGRVRVDARAREGVSETLAGVGLLHAEVVALAQEAGLRPVPVPLHLACRSEGDALSGLPVEALERLLAEGYTPVLCGTLVRDDALGWRVVSADELVALLAPELEPRLAVFVTDVDGVFDPHPDAPGARLVGRLADAAAVDRVASLAEGPGEDVTGRMRGKLMRALAASECCPVLVLNGTVRGRLLDALRGKAVPGTRVGGS